MATPSSQSVKAREQEEQNTQRRAGLLGLQYLDTTGYSEGAALYKDILTIDEMRKGRIIPLSDGNEEVPLIFAITVSTPQPLLTQIRSRFQTRIVQFMMISDSGFEEMILRYDPPKKVVYEDVKLAKAGDNNTVAEVSRTLSEVRADDMLNYLILQADRLNASDIHLETQRSEVRVRFRIDGTLHPIATMTGDKYRVLLASIASRGNISTAASEAQTGHMQQEIKDSAGKVARLLNMRIESVPTVYGTDVVVRLFNFDPKLLNIKSLGLDTQQQDTINEIIAHPHGMVLVVGPTGSGKSTTLYSIINGLNTPERKILTLEDPVELAVPGISQIPVNTQGGDSFAEKLRAVLRLDPDVVMVGEIRDVDTAKTAIQASITGHLVLATFHAASAATAFSRMIDMIGQNPIFATAIRLVVGQRLVRRLDDATKVAYKPDETTVAYIKDVLKNLPKGYKEPDYSTLQLYKPGISGTNPFGYSGRVSVMEQMTVGPRIQAYLRGEQRDVNADAIEATAKSEGMLTMLQDGVLKACAGQTTLEEVGRVI